MLGLDYSPIKGPEGNIEYLIYLRKIAKSAACHLSGTDDRPAALAQEESPACVAENVDPETIVKLAHEDLDR